MYIHPLFVCFVLLSAAASAEQSTPPMHAENTPHPPVPSSGAHFVNPPYGEQKVIFDFYFDDPQKISPALHWIRALVKPLIEPPYDYLPEFLDIKVILHGTEIVSLARKNYAAYRDAIERMRYFAANGVEFRVCAQALEEYGYRPEDLQDFVKIVPSAITDIAHWQIKGYALITPQILEKKFSIDEIR